ncbi:MAG: DUF6531 domain-containing protein [Actinomycetota bacterium]
MGEPLPSFTPPDGGPIVRFRWLRSDGLEFFATWDFTDPNNLDQTGLGSGGTFRGSSVGEFRLGKFGVVFTGFECLGFKVPGRSQRLPCDVDASLTVSDGGSQGDCEGQPHMVAGLCANEIDPVNTSTGGYYHEATDLSLPGIGVPFALSRSYNSTDPSTGIFGRGWSSIFEMRLVAVSGASAPAVQAKRPFAGSAAYYQDSPPPVPQYEVPEGQALPAPETGVVASVGAQDLTNAPAPRQGQPILLRAETGGQLVFFPDGSAYRGQDGVTSTLEALPGGGFLLTSQDQLRYLFDAQGRLRRVEERNGQGISMVYSGSRVSQVTDSVGRIISFTYAGSRLSTVSLPDGRSVSYGYTNGQLTGVTDVRGNPMRYGYNDARGLLTDVFDQEDHHVVHNVYDALGRVMAQQGARGFGGTFTYEPGKVTFTDDRGSQRIYQESGNILLSAADGEGGRREYTRDASLDLAAITDPRAKLWSFSYDARHNLTSVTGPAGTNISAQMTYTARNDVDTVTNARGFATDYGYDARGNLVTIDRPGQADTTLTREAVTGLVASIKTGSNHSTSFGYNTRGELISVSPELGRPMTFDYDPSGRLVSMTEPRGNIEGMTPAERAAFTWDYAYDAAGNLLLVRDPLDQETRYLYDRVGNLCRAIDANGTATLAAPPTGCANAPALAGETVYEYFEDDLLERVVAADESATSYVYDAVGNLDLRTDAMGRQTSYVYDEANRLIRASYPLGRTFLYEHDAAGSICRMLDANGVAASGATSLIGCQAQGTTGETAYGFDNAGRTSSITYADADTPDVTFDYDQNSNRTQMTDGAGTETYAYDQLDRLIAITRPGTGTISYEHDAASNVTKRSYPDGTVVDYTFDANERLDAVTTGLRTTDYDYDVSGNLIETAYPNGWKDARSYDAAGRLDQIQTLRAGDVLNSFDYSRDAVGNPVSIASVGRMDQQVQDPDTGDWSPSPTPDETTHFSYDPLYRLTGACYGAPCGQNPAEFASYSYDGVGNRLTETIEGSGRSFAYNDADQLVSIDGDASFAYDANGNMLTDGTEHYEYDQAGNRLVHWQLQDGARRTATYGFDGDGKRLSVQGEARGGGPSAPPRPYEENFLWDPNFSLPMMVTADGTGARSGHTNFTYGLGLISQDPGSGPTFLHPDGIGSVAGVTAADGTPLVRRSYEAFGEARGRQILSPNGQIPGASDFGFAGEYQDFNSGLYHLRARQYDPGLGRFISEDPLGSSAFSSEYVYVGDRPGVMVDPRGTHCDPPTSATGDASLFMCVGNNMLEDEREAGNVVFERPCGGDGAAARCVTLGELEQCGLTADHIIFLASDAVMDRSCVPYDGQDRGTDCLETHERVHVRQDHDAGGVWTKGILWLPRDIFGNTLNILIFDEDVKYGIWSGPQPPSEVEAYRAELACYQDK